MDGAHVHVCVNMCAFIVTRWERKSHCVHVIIVLWSRATDVGEALGFSN